ncbi:lysylphosphatidylglycerol synthase domain-containing protein [Alkalinema sp. FACHB-956]|uniref:lysylphosphatidylglycerol synthase domain-containing protein n=1 Tax=Alkalinema sp. FACHB-956 TaxID=2692768 RepID=UPI00168577A0|nr:lysylphosphatidylglycerol synthase domain-containing protein [Alkalinema sp. FACHB-956]MBD2329837.1 flippase-like domain-containing protein [Alkalinema sp. FACHB-956]
MSTLKSQLSRVSQGLSSLVKGQLRFVVIGVVVFFLTKTLLEHGQGVLSLRLGSAGLASLAIALGMTLLAHILAGMVWANILQDLGQMVTYDWGMAIYLKTNIAKYLPGNVWHFYGRLQASQAAKVPGSIAAISILLEPLLLVLAAVALAIVGLQPLLAWQTGAWTWGIQGCCLFIILVAMHPQFLNIGIQQLVRLKQKTLGGTDINFALRHYPWCSFLGEFSFLILRGTGFFLVCLAVSPFAIDHLQVLYGGFAIAWLLGFIIPGLPGGIGVFEAVALALLSPFLPTTDLLAILALYRLINTIAEALGAGLVVASERQI